jgi:uncharacterized membrane protein
MTPARMRFRVALQVGAVVVTIAYPVIMYLGLTRVGTRFAAVSLLTLSAGHTLVQALQQRRFAWRSALIMPLCAAALWLDDRRYMLAMPVLINAGLFAAFYGSLHGDVSLCERFARMQVKDLSPREQVYCRSITKLWAGFFVINGGTAAALAALGALDLWTLYTGLIAYVLIGLIAATEYTVRKYRFGRFGDGLHDRILRAVLPDNHARSTPP